MGELFEYVLERKKRREKKLCCSSSPLRRSFNFPAELPFLKREAAGRLLVKLCVRRVRRRPIGLRGLTEPFQALPMLLTSSIRQW